MARLSSALSYVDHDHAVELALGALELSRAECAPTDLAYVMRCRMRGWFDPDRVNERLAMAVELTEIGQRTDDGVAESWGWRWQSVIRFEWGDAPGIEFSCRQLSALAERLHLPNQQWSAAFRLAALRVFQGRFADADSLLDQAETHAQRLDNTLTASIEFEVRDTLRWLRGEPPRTLSANNPWDRGLCWQRSDPAHILDEFAQDPDAYLDADIERLQTILNVALTVRRCPHPAAAAAAEPWAQRYTHLVAIFQPGAMMFGSMHLYAGLLARAAGHRATAVEHFRAARRRQRRHGCLAVRCVRTTRTRQRTTQGQGGHHPHGRVDEAGRRTRHPLAQYLMVSVRVHDRLAVR
jgi:hypothetical protein